MSELFKGEVRAVLNTEQERILPYLDLYGSAKLYGIEATVIFFKSPPMISAETAPATAILDGLPGASDDAFASTNSILAWLAQQPETLQVQLAPVIFSRLLKEAGQPRDTSTNACTKLCGFVQQCTKSQIAGIQEWAFSRGPALQLLDFYLDRNENDQHRSMKLVLDVLTTSLSNNPNTEASQTTKGVILEILVSTIGRQSTRAQIKSATTSLSHFVSKGLISLDDIAAEYTKFHPHLAQSDINLWTSFVLELFSLLTMHHVCPVVGKFIVLILLRLRERDAADYVRSGRSSAEVWRDWVCAAIDAHPETLESIKGYVIGPMFKSDRLASLDLLRGLIALKPATEPDSDNMDNIAMLQLAALEMGKKSGLVAEPEPRGESQLQNVVFLEAVLLKSFLTSPSGSVRSSALSLLISSQVTTRPFSPIVLALLRIHLAPYHSEPDAKLRYEVLGYTRDMVKRLKSVIAVAHRAIARRFETKGDAAIAVPVRKKRKPAPEHLLADEKEAAEILQAHQSFLDWYLEFLKGELVPTTSYQRRSTALRATLIVLRPGREEHAGGETLDHKMLDLIASDPAWIRLILDRVMDSFEDIRESATSLLTLFPEETVHRQNVTGEPSGTVFGTVEEFSRKANRLAGRTGRADFGDGSARVYGLLCRWSSTFESKISLAKDVIARLESKLAKAEADLGQAVVEESIHGDFASISYIWQVLIQSRYEEAELNQLVELGSRIVQCCKRVWKTVQHVLCDDSPEGHLPEDMEDIDGLETKELLSYSFRAVHESSNLTRIIISSLSLSGLAGALYPTLETFQTAGDLAFEQLSMLRHRGAFTTVSLTFRTACQLAKNLTIAYPNETVDPSQFLGAWYKGTLHCIMTLASTTRRSAGIPFLMTGLLASDAEFPSFGEVFGTLEEIAYRPARISETDGSNLAQVHALNCLKEIFKNSLLSRRAELYLSQTFELAAKCLKSEVWAIRNCGLLLLRSLIDSIFGTSDSKSVMESGWDGHTVRIMYSRYQTLPTVLLGLIKSGSLALETSASSAAAESVFPALDIIRRAGPPEELQSELYEHITDYLGSHIWHVREMAARTLCSFLLQDNWLERVKDLLNQSPLENNKLHGLLMTIKFVLERRHDLGRYKPDDVLRIKRQLENLVERGIRSSMCPDVLAAYLDIDNFMTSVQSRDNRVFSDTSPDPPTLNPSTTSLAAGYLDRGGLPSAALQTQLSIGQMLGSVHVSIEAMDTTIANVLAADIDTACTMLRKLPEIWNAMGQATNAADTFQDQCRLYIAVCRRSRAPELRAIAMTNLAELMDKHLEPAYPISSSLASDLDQLWMTLQDGDINPTLSWAIIRVSGPMFATMLLQPGGSTESVRARAQSWGWLVADALDIYNDFDTRMAAAEGLRSFTWITSKHGLQPLYLMPVLAIYDALNDDDEEVREVACAAAAPLVGQRMAPLEAADALLKKLQIDFGLLDDFRGHVVARMAGQATSTTQFGRSTTDWTPAKLELDSALNFDESLFAEEEQNLFIDEVRETQRWTAVLESLDWSPEDPLIATLQAWSIAGLRELVDLAAKDDGALGWSSEPPVYAICIRVLSCAVSLTSRWPSPEIEGLLHAFVQAGRRSHVHELLLAKATRAPTSDGEHKHDG